MPMTATTNVALWRRQVEAAAIVLVLLLGGPNRTEANPAWGGNCADCHTKARPEAANLLNTVLRDVPGHGFQPVLPAFPGDVVEITARVGDGHDRYSIALRGLSGGGLADQAHHLVFTPDAGWSSAADYFYVPSSTVWPRDWSYELALAPTTPPDYYALRSTVAGKGGGLWSDTELFYVWVQEVPEPATLGGAGTLVAALAAMGWWRRRCEPGGGGAGERGVEGPGGERGERCES